MDDVFLSSASASASVKQAGILANELRTLGISTWIADHEILAGDDWEQRIRHGIKNARAVVFLVDQLWLSSEVSKLESMTALELSWSDEDKILLPVLIGHVDPPSFLRHIQGIKVQAQKPDWPRVAKEIAKILDAGPKAKPRTVVVAAVKEQAERLNLIQEQADLLRAFEIDQRKNPKIM
jgi:hypothetical protein